MLPRPRFKARRVQEEHRRVIVEVLRHEFAVADERAVEAGVVPLPHFRRCDRLSEVDGRLRRRLLGHDQYRPGRPNLQR